MKAAGTLKGHKQLLDSVLFEKKVAEDCGGAETWRIVCTVCNHENGDFDVVTDDGRVKECKSGLTSAVAGAAQFKKLEILVEKKMLLGPQKFMKTAVKQEHFDAVAAAREDLKDRLQAH